VKKSMMLGYRQWVWDLALSGGTDCDKELHSNTFCPGFRRPMILSMCLTRAHGRPHCDAQGWEIFMRVSPVYDSYILTDLHVSRESGGV